MKEKKSNYLVLTELFLPTKGGTAVWFDAVYQKIGGKEIHIVTADVQGGLEYDKTHKNTVHRVSMKRYWWLRPESLAMYFKLFFVSLRVALSNKIDVIHAGRVLPEGLVGLLIAKIIRKQLFIYAHGEEITTWHQSAGKFKAMKFTYRHAHKVIANSEFTKEQLEKIGIKSDKIIIISPGVDIERFQPIKNVEEIRESINITNKQKLILSVGRLCRRKGFDQVIKSLTALHKEGIDARYAIIGIGEDKDYLENLAKSESVEKFVHMLGHVSSDDLPRWYNAADVFAMPNRDINGDTEGFGMVYLEAAACGRTSIAGDAGGTGAAVLDDKTGLRVDGDSQQSIFIALKRLLTNDGYALSLGSAAYQRAIKDFSWENIAKKTLKL